MRERPILFSARAILDGRKTVTRRLMKPTPHKVDGGVPFSDAPAWAHAEPGSAVMRCPYGVRGDRLWVRETWRIGAWNEDDQQIAVDYFDGPDKNWRQVPLTPEGLELFDRLWIQSSNECLRKGVRPNVDGNYRWKPGESPLRWRPSIHMPRWASRITLEVTGVRVERLQDISEVDAISEGVRQMRDGSECWVGREGPRGLVTPWPTAREAFRDLWRSINGPDSWAENPFVWVIEFKRIKS